MTANGRLNVSTQLVGIEGQYLSPATAEAYIAMLAAAAKLGHGGSIYSPAGAYRSRAMQQDMHNNRDNYNIRPGVILAPVGFSTHGQGRAVDVKADSSAARAWFHANASKFGFSRPQPSVDPDHYELGQRVTTVTDPTPSPAPPPPIRKAEFDMLIIKPSTTGGFSPVPVARILTDLLHSELVTDTPRIASIDFASSRTGGPAQLVFDKANWDQILLLPDFPEGVAATVGGLTTEEHDKRRRGRSC